jgi:hypothetical protein
MTPPGFRHQHQDLIESIVWTAPEQRDRWFKMMHGTGLFAA